MGSYVIRQVCLAAGVLLTAVIILFCLIYLVPGDPATIALGPRASAEQKELFRQQMGLDQPVPVQALRFLGNLARGDLGTDLLTRQPVAALVLGALPKTIVLALVGLGWAILLGIPLGCVSALRPNGWMDRLIGLFSTGVIALPSFLLAIYSLILFAVVLGWLPAMGAGEPGDLGDQIAHLVLPAFAVGLGWVGYIARLVRASLLETLQENHIRTYRAFGISDMRIALRFALPIAMIPVVAVIGVGLGNLLSGAVLVEVVFSRPGLGSLAHTAVTSRNSPVLVGTVLVTTLLYVGANLATDLIAALLDPRIRKEG
ncbi:peptide/nickel transport system permease protein [Ancylobacter sp. 3268]|uniref:ABC transporter permease n=1 Tax=Ancylobacter sp. 3268 TaxID=2817752 RepID=UPI0028572411|nr:ABC transporter permease [Ancylobacter sp. 3268]MDR6953221.1 peptide/nickel transport system permease protein [Ancylobacter sp. 3268]